MKNKSEENIPTESQNNKNNEKWETEKKSMRPRAQSEKVNIYIMLEFGKRK